MGMWNSVCSITNLPILEGEPVYAIVLGNTILKPPLLKVDDLFHPIFPPVKGYYNSYGSIRDIVATPRIHLIEDVFKWLLSSERYIPNHDDEFGCADTDKLTISSILNNAERKWSTIYVEDEYQVLHLSLIHEFVFDLVMNEFLSKCDETVCETEHVKVFIPPPNPLPKRISAHFIWKNTWEGEDNNYESNDSEVAQLLKDSAILTQKYRYGCALKEDDKKNMMQAKSDFYISLADVQRGDNELFALEIALLRLRKLWLPSCGGSQTENYSFYRKLVKESLKAIKCRRDES